MKGRIVNMMSLRFARPKAPKVRSWCKLDQLERAHAASTASLNTSLTCWETMVIRADILQL